MNLSERIPEVREMIALAALKGTYEPPKRPSKLYRMAMAPTKSPYNFRKKKVRRKMAKQSRRINRRH